MLIAGPSALNRRPARASTERSRRGVAVGSCRYSGGFVGGRWPTACSRLVLRLEPLAGRSSHQQARAPRHADEHVAGAGMARDGGFGPGLVVVGALFTALPRLHDGEMARLLIRGPSALNRSRAPARPNGYLGFSRTLGLSDRDAHPDDGEAEPPAADSAVQFTD